MDMANDVANLAILQGQGLEEAGAVVWWELSGMLSGADLADELLARGFSANDPAVLNVIAPSPEVALYRAAAQALRGRKHLLRTISRGSWEAFEEQIVRDADGDERLEVTSIARGGVRRSAGSEPQPFVKSTHPELGPAFAELTLAAYGLHRRVWHTSDVGGWMIYVANQAAVSAVALRSSGGFYFVPRSALARWRAMAEAVQAVSSNVLRELPAMKTEQCAQAVIAAVQREAAQGLSEVQSYLSGEVTSKRGIASAESRIADALAKIQRYADLFGGDFGALRAQAEELQAGCAIAMLAAQAAAGATA
jgi:hypothetical protein